MMLGLAGATSKNNKAGRTFWPGVARKRTVHMSDISRRKLRVKEQSEAYLRQLRTIPFSEGLHVMEQLLDELYMHRDIHNCERDTLTDEDSCSTDQDR